MLKQEEVAKDKEKEKGCHLEMGFEENEEGLFVRGGENENDEDDDDGEQEEINVDEEESDTEPERQEKMEEGSSSVDMAQLMARIITMQSQLNSRLDDIDGKLHNRLDDIDEKIVDIQDRFLLNKKNIFGFSRLHYIESKDLGDQGIMKKKSSSH
ncbi:hypothetical protein M9H77_30484 [Catharanthus roseus]|uniref:Uncharacterized protein n=1 Tax=Catharanthus roseus TaxID=4058 RepID=A0ACC0A010_CATRO|nr:hypothetical protein M9H77_30484 [Catharanthus roseus]